MLTRAFGRGSPVSSATTRPLIVTVWRAEVGTCGDCARTTSATALRAKVLATMRVMNVQTTVWHRRPEARRWCYAPHFMAFTITKNLILPSTVTGSWPRPRWFDMSMWARPLDTCMMDIRFREKFQDALAVVISDEERAGLDILTHGDFHCDEDFGGRSWHHYPLQRWAGFDGDYLQSEQTRSPWLRYPPGTLLNEIYTGWRWPRVVDKVEHRPLDYPKIWRLAQAKTAKPVRFGTCCSQVMGLFLDLHTPKYKDNREVLWD